MSAADLRVGVEEGEVVEVVGEVAGCHRVEGEEVPLW